MIKLIGLALTVSVGALALPAVAADGSQDAAFHSAKAASVQARLATAAAAHKAVAKVMTARASSVDAVQSAFPGTPYANPYRAYPPSCAADPLPDTPSGPASEIYTTRMPLFTRGSDGLPAANSEMVNVTIWRLACSSSGKVTPYNSTGQFSNAMTLLRIDRDAANENNKTTYPTFPLLLIKQGSVGYTDDASRVRAAVEPNTVISDGPFDAPIFASTTYSLENFPYGAAYNHQYSDGFSLVVDPILNNYSPPEFVINPYSPTQTTYPDAFNPLPVDGYMATAYYDLAHPGEGIFVNIYDVGDGLNRSFFGAWFTYDELGLPFWITAQGTFGIGDTTVHTTGTYVTGGVFGSGAPTGSENHTWGTLNFTFPDCGKMHFDFNGAADAITNGPGGQGTRDWIRIGDENGMPCE